MSTESKPAVHTATPEKWKIRPVMTAQKDAEAICFSEYMLVVDGHTHLITYRETAEANARLMMQSLRTRESSVKALRAISIALAEPAGGEYWTVRKLADEWGIFNDDLEGPRVLLKVAERALALAEEQE